MSTGFEKQESPAEPLKCSWYGREIHAHEWRLAGIYLWKIEDGGLYVGQARRLHSRLRQYPNNVRKLLEKLPYRRTNPNGYRVVHHAMAEARKLGRDVQFSVLETCDAAMLNERERYWIMRFRKEAECGGLPVLNSN